MQLDFTYTFEDFSALSKALQRRYWWGALPGWLWIVIAIVAWVLAVASFIFPAPGTFLHTWGGLFLMVIGGAIFGGAIGLWLQVRSYYRKQKLDRLEVSYVIGEDGIRARSSQYDSLMNWTAFDAASRAPGYRFIWLNKLQGMVFPDRCFESEAQMKEFDSFVCAKLGGKAEL